MTSKAIQTETDRKTGTPATNRPSKTKAAPKRRHFVEMTLASEAEHSRYVWWNGEDVRDLAAELEKLVRRAPGEVRCVVVHDALYDRITDDTGWMEDYMVATDLLGMVLIDNEHPRNSCARTTYGGRFFARDISDFTYLEDEEE